MLTLKAPAKLNLGLEVLGHRDDGYHEVVTVLQTVDLCDTVTLERADTITLGPFDKPFGSAQDKLRVSGSGLPQEDDLAWQAAFLLQGECGVEQGVRIGLEKAIPEAAGLGGGSSDAAAVLRGLNALWELGFSRERLAELGARLGSDVPFFVYGGTALAQGRGERILPLPPAQLPWVVLLCPPVPVPARKTAALYEALTPAQFTRGVLTNKLAERIRGKGDIPIELLFNAFDGVALRMYPDLEVYWKAFQELGAPEVHLCGSGPAMYTLLPRRELATALRALLSHARGWPAYVVQPFTPEAL